MDAKRFRDVLDPGDPYWPRVRRLHTYFWANGVLREKKWLLAVDSFLFLCINIFLTVVSITWRGVLLLGALWIVDWTIPGLVSCVTSGATNYAVPYFASPDCTMINQEYLPLLSMASLTVVVILLIYPIRQFVHKVIEMVFMCVSIITLGYPLRFLAYLAALSPNLAGKWLDKSHVIGPLTFAMSLPTDYQEQMDRLWELFEKSLSPANKSELEEFLKEYEERYFG